MKKITIIIPIYNSKKYIDKCITSILNQTYKNFELILINDGSKDNSLSIIKDYSKKDNRIKVINQNNIGVAETRNKGIDIATGEYITFIDQDDWIENNYLEKFLSNSKNNDIIIGGYKRVDEEGIIINKYQPKNTPWAKYTFITPWARIYKKKFLISNNIKFLPSKIGEDIYFNLNAYNKTTKIKIINYTGYNWQDNKKSISNTIHKSLNKKIDIIKFLNNLYSIREEKYKEYFDFYCYKFGIWYLLYSGRNSSSKEFINEYNKIHNWNKEHNIKMNIFPFSKKLSGEKLSVKFYILIFNIISNMKLIKLFSKIYCKY